MAGSCPAVINGEMCQLRREVLTKVPVNGSLSRRREVGTYY
jgi:hypothetical protein